MTSAFITALGALRANQSWIDVIGNNLANSNTPGFKTSRALFADLLSSTQRQATPATGTTGGTNPLQIGLGTQLASVSRQLSQGSLDSTGRSFDLAILGNGFFSLANGAQTLYTRVGTFGLDATGNLVDQRTGRQVLNTVGSTISIDTTAVLGARATQSVGFSGNLPAEKTGPLAEELSSSSAFSEGSAATLSATDQGAYNIPVGETWTMEFIVNGGAPQTVSIAGSISPYSAQDIVDEINAVSELAEDLTASLDGAGDIQIVSNRTGSASSIQVLAGQSGKDLQSLTGLEDFAKGSETVATLTSDLNDLTGNIADYVDGDTIQFNGTDVDGDPVVASFTYGAANDGTTLGDLTSFLDAEFSQADVAFDVGSGRITVTAQTAGEADLSLSITDAANQTGKSDWASSFFSVSTNGAGPDVVTTSVEVFETNGAAHVLTFDYTRQADDSWTLGVSSSDPSNTFTGATIPGITFNADGSVQLTGSTSFGVDFGSGSQTIDISLGNQGNFNGLTQFGSPASVIIDSQDGYSAGELANVQVLPDGAIEAFYTNGQTQTLDTLGISTFTNPQGLEAVGDSFFRASANSGTRVLADASSGSNGQIVAGALETSNVDTAEEFVRLIQAQRGFQANARVITVQDELLSEVVNIV